MRKESIADIQLWPQVSSRSRVQATKEPEVVHIYVKPEPSEKSAIWPFLAGMMGSASFWLVFWGLFLGPVQ